ncbi:MAG: hypothetical protein GX897_07445 [Clostridiales bacterium]|nr:hypothetical protein [Clostridiales bacterium]
MKKSLSLLLSILIILSAIPFASSAFYDPAGGFSVYKESLISSETLSDGLTMSRIYAWNPENETPGETLRGWTLCWDPRSYGSAAIYTNGGSVYGRKTLTSMAETEKMTNPQAAWLLAGVNLDFFSMKTGVPLGISIKDNILLSSGEGASFVVTSNGDASIRRLSTRITISSGGAAAKIDHLNKFPGVYGAYLLNTEYGESTHSEQPSREIVIQTGQTGFYVNSTIQGVVLRVDNDVTDTPLTPGCAVLSIANDSAAFSDPLFSSLKAGDQVSINIDVDGLPQQSGVGFIDSSSGFGGGSPASASDNSFISFAFGGGDEILQNGCFDENLTDEDHEKEKNPRTAVGIRPDGGVVFFSCDGKLPEKAEGLTLAQLAEAMKSLGCINALNLDGGGSSTVAADTPRGFVPVNIPKDGAERKISNALIFCKRPGGYDLRLHIEPEKPAVMAGGSVDFSCWLRSTTGWTKLSPDDVSYGVNQNSGSFSGSTFTAGAPGKAEISASLRSGGHEGYVEIPTVSAAVMVADRLTRLILRSSSERAALDGWVDFTPEGSYYPLDCAVGIDDLKFGENYTPELDPTWRPDTAGRNRGEPPEDILYWSRFGYIVRADNAARYKLYNNYNLVGVDTDIIIAEAGAGGAAGEYEISLGIGTDLLSSASSRLEPGLRGIEVTANTTDAASLAAELRDADGNTFVVEYQPKAALNRAKKTILTAEIPKTAAQPLTFVRVLYSAADAARYVSYSALKAVYLEPGDTFADTGDSWAYEYIEKAHLMGIADGYKIDGGRREYRPAGLLTRAEFAKLLTSYLEISDNPSVVIADNCPEWAKPYVRAAVSAGLMRGRGDGEDVIFAASDNITRAEVMQVLGALLKDKPPAAIDFTDKDKLPAWAADNAALCVGAGVISGYPDGSLKPGGLVTRAEIAAIFAKLDAAM